MLTGRFTFDEHSHTYRVGEWHVPGTSEIMLVAGRVSQRWYTNASRDRGDIVHRLTHKLDLGNIDIDRITTQYRGWCLAYAQFVEDLRPEYDGLEHCVVDRRLGFATTIDRSGTLYGRRMVLNIKSGLYHPAHDVVRAGELLALEGWANPAVDRYTLYLSPSQSTRRRRAKYRLEHHQNPRDFDEFLDDLEKWRRECHQPSRHGPKRLLRRLNKRSWLSRRPRS